MAGVSNLGWAMKKWKMSPREKSRRPAPGRLFESLQERAIVVRTPPHVTIRENSPALRKDSLARE